MWRRKRFWNHKMSLSLSLSPFHSFTTYQYDKGFPNLLLLILIQAWNRVSDVTNCRLPLATLLPKNFRSSRIFESGEKSKILYNDTTTWIRSKCMHCRTLQENAVRISTKSTVFCWFQQIWENNVKIEPICH